MASADGKRAAKKTATPDNRTRTIVMTKPSAGAGMAALAKFGVVLRKMQEFTKLNRNAHVVLKDGVREAMLSCVAFSCREKRHVARQLRVESASSRSGGELPDPLGVAANKEVDPYSETDAGATEKGAAHAGIAVAPTTGATVAKKTASGPPAGETKGNLFSAFSCPY